MSHLLTKDWSKAGIQPCNGFAWLLLLVLCKPLEARALDQAAAQEEAKRVQDEGSDESLKRSYGNGLQAVNQFFNLNIPGAITYGVKAYGQYRNSEKLDSLKDKSKLNENGMASNGVSGPAASGSIGHTEFVSPYARLGTKFLHEGETAIIAEKIEKLSGISRDKMFQIAAETHSHSRTLDDPGFISWAMKTYRELTAKSPNKNFRDALEKFGDKTEGLIKTGAARGILAQFRQKDSERMPSAKLSESSDGVVEPPAVPGSTEVAEEVADEAGPEPDPNGLGETAGFTSRGVVAVNTPNQRPGFDRLQFDAKDKFFIGLLQAADPARDNGPSIFQKVSQKIRELNERQKLNVVSLAR